MTAMQHASRTLPVVFAGVSDPVGAGLVDSLARPGGNATGFMNFEYSLSGKWVELLKQIAPDVKRVAVLRDPAIPAGIGQFSAIQGAAQSLGVEVSAIGIRDSSEMELQRNGTRSNSLCSSCWWRSHGDGNRVGIRLF